MAYSESEVDTALESDAIQSDYDEVLAELAALRLRIDELERDRPSLELHALQDECNSSVPCATKDGNFSVNFGGRVELDWLWASEDNNGVRLLSLG